MWVRKLTEHIAFVVNSYPPRLGGLEMHVSHLAEGLAKIGFRVTVFTVGESPGIKIQNGVEVHTVRGFFNIGSVLSFPALGTTRRIAKHICLNNVSAVSVHTRFFPMTWLGLRAAKQTGATTILTEHGSNSVTGVTPVIAIASRLVDKTLGKWSLATANHVLSVSKESAEFVQRLSGRTAHLFPNAIDTKFWSKESRNRLFNLVFIGRLVPGKGWFESIQAFNAVAPKNEQVKLHIFGSGPESSKILEMKEKSPNSERIFIHGAQPQTDIRAQLSGAVFINPTTLSEGFQTTVLEAAASAARIVSFSVPGLNEIRQSGALVFEAEDSKDLIDKTITALSTQPKALTHENQLSWDWTSRVREFSELLESQCDPMTQPQDEQPN